MNGAAKYRACKALGPLAVLAYAVIAVTATPIRGRELFPFFNWSLFSEAANPKTDIVLIVRSIDGTPLNRPTLYYDLPERFSAAATRNAGAAKTFDLLALAIRGHDKAGEQRFRALVERNYLREASTADYDLAKIAYDPIDRLKTNSIIRTRIIASYVKRDAR